MTPRPALVDPHGGPMTGNRGGPMPLANQRLPGPMSLANDTAAITFPTLKELSWP